MRSQMTRTSARGNRQTRGILVLLMLVLALIASGVVVAGDTHTEDPPPRPESSPVEPGYMPSLGISASLDTSPDHPLAPDEDEQASLEAIFGTDDRQRVTPTTNFPASGIAQIQMYRDGSGYGTCTGTFIGPDAVLTSAHCIHTQATGFASAIAVLPGRDGASQPFGFEWASDAWIPQDWVSTGDAHWDWGIVRLPDHTLGNSVGWFEIGVLSTQSLEAPNFNPVVTGYPGDKKFGTMWTGSEPAFTTVSNPYLFYTIDTMPGQSGAAVRRASDQAVVGIHMGSTSNANIAARINQNVLNYLLSACSSIGCEISRFIEGATPDPGPISTPVPSPTVPPPPAPTPTATPVPDPPPDGSDNLAPPPGQPGTAEPIGSHHYERTWRRTDGPIIDGHISRTWMWGPAPFSPAIPEPYLETPGGERQVQYFDKSRMEITYPDNDANSVWYVTNGLLARELITGNRQIGDALFTQHPPAQINVAGDGNDPNGPTYATFRQLMGEHQHSIGETVIQTVDRAGNVASNQSLSSHGVTAAHFVPETGHTVASTFWAFMNSSGPIYDDSGLTSGALFQSPFYASGLPLTEPFWATVRIGGQERTVLIQVFERRVLTYTPDNPSGWQVEAGNVGIHYFLWRYVDHPD